MAAAFVSIILGSDLDLPAMQGTIEVLSRMQVPHTIKIASAHRSPQAVENYVSEAEKQGCVVYICASSMAAHLAGAVAARTTHPVIGVPLDSGAGMGGMDALLSTVQMPAGVPVATVAVGSEGARNAGYLAAQIISLADIMVGKRLKLERDTQASTLAEKDEVLQKKLRESTQES